MVEIVNTTVKLISHLKLYKDKVKRTIGWWKRCLRGHETFEIYTIVNRRKQKAAAVFHFHLILNERSSSKCAVIDKTKVGANLRGCNRRVLEATGGI